MVLLTITPAAKTAIDRYNAVTDSRTLSSRDDVDALDEPSLIDVSVGDPVSHTQLLRISDQFRQRNAQAPGAHSVTDLEVARLDALLRGSKIHTPPPKPKPEPSPQYVALMAKLRREEEERAYERMINPPLPTETFSQRFPSAAPAIPVKVEDDEVVYADVNRQLALIVNVLVSVIACSIAIWIAARHWSVPQRLALSMGGSGLVAAAEIVIFSGYIRRVREAKQLEGRRIETKEVMETWVIDKKELHGGGPVAGDLRYRKPVKGKHR
ncbi:hypothetical protein AAFC00_001136 [Neodothiora populina]|uniref:ATPase, vacuolar ER assembly factor, Vma12 n=1 Tax=Neodothiora populina TaxID=2781224 RepID=A0ABR3PMX2_9PEZI